MIIKLLFLYIVIRYELYLGSEKLRIKDSILALERDGTVIDHEDALKLLTNETTLLL